MSLAKTIENRIIESFFQDHEEKKILIKNLMEVKSRSGFDKILKEVEENPEPLQEIFDESCSGDDAFRVHRTPRDLFNSLSEVTANHAEFI